ncbi:MAG TPA: SMP-30/gluconolactonase/LRE family protein [Jatrophihabitans sp.]|nr:SMP-30/gluconolactonase/LRE family protein [Jatrophihabitans sp.]
MDEAEPLAGPAAQLGDGPGWDATEQCLRYVDIVAGRLYRWWYGTGETNHQDFVGLLGAAVPRVGGGLVLSLDGHLVACDPWGEVQDRYRVETEVAGNRLNDAQCDPAGRLYVGSMAGLDRPGAAALYRVDPDWRVQRVLGGTTISNGLGWSPDAATMYFADSGAGRVYAFDYDVRTASMSRQREFCALEPADGAPDGLTVDTEGYLWVATFGGGTVRRYSPSGRLDGLLRLPVRNVTSCAFGGPGLDELFITTAAIELTDAERAAQPDAGRIFRYRPGVTGLPQHKFAG